MSLINGFYFNREQLSIDWADGQHSELQALWLRDHEQLALDGILHHAHHRRRM